MRVLPLFKKTSGLKTIVDPSRIQYDPDLGLEFLAAAKNIDIDDSGRISRRRGFTSTLRVEAIRCLFSEGGITLAVSGSKLCLLKEDLSWTVLRSDLTPGARMGYVRVKDRVYYCNGHQKGYVENGENHDWVRGEYVGPATAKVFQDPPLGHLLEVGMGRLFIGSEDTLWWSRRFDYSSFDLARDFLFFEEGLRMVGAVDGGLFVSTDREIIFLQGDDAEDFRYISIANYPAVEGTMVRVDGSLVGDGSIEGRVLLFATVEGICLAGSGGRFLNLTKDRIILPTARYGSGLIYKGRYICLLEP